MSSIQERAKAELDRIDFGAGDTQAMLNILRIFFETWNSGGAVSVAAPVLCRLLEGKPLAPLTGEVDEWHDPMGDGKLLQNVRMSTVFMEDGRCYDIEDPERKTITFPYSGYIPVSGSISMPELTLEQLKEYEAGWSRAGGFSWSSSPEAGDTLTTDHIKRGKAWLERETVGEDMDLDDAPKDLGDVYLQAIAGIDHLYDTAIDLREQLDVEGAHTAAANAEIDGLRGRLEASIKSNEGMLDKIEQLKAELAVWKV